MVCLGRATGRIYSAKAGRGGARRSQDWASRKRRDDGYAARSAYKLLELDKSHKVLPRAGSVLDLGCAPGAWLQVACESLKQAKGGPILGIDTKHVDTDKLSKVDGRVKFKQADVEVMDPGEVKRAAGKEEGFQFDAVLSDMAPNTTGAKDADAARSHDLCARASELALEGDLLARGGSLVVKLLEGPGGGLKALQHALKPHFNKVAFCRPKATRSPSSEVFIVGLHRTS